MSDEKQRAMMAAHLCEESARLFRGDGPKHGAESAMVIASYIRVDTVPESDYRRGLKCLGYAPEQIDAAVTAIADGKHPPDSLPARVAKMRDEARDAPPSTADEDYLRGVADGLRDVLALLGVKS